MSTPAASAFPQALLVAMDFSPSARRALDRAMSWSTSGEVTALHVIDSEFVARVEASGLGSAAAAVAKLRARAEEEFGWLVQEKGADIVSPMIVEGIPFVEIVKIASDLEVDMIVMGTHPRTSSLEEVLFGGTAEKVLRTSRCPVLCVP